MRVRLTGPHFVHLERQIGSSGLLHEAFTRDREFVPGTKGVDIVAPYIAWEILMDRLMDTFMTGRRARRSDLPSSGMRLISRIAKAKNAVDRHPALKRVGMLGMQGGWFPLWRSPDGVLSPRPVEGWQFVVLGAHWQDRNGVTPVTTWEEYGVYPKNHWLADEAAHSRLLPECR
jgi:hypothetical protein